MQMHMLLSHVSIRSLLVQDGLELSKLLSLFLQSYGVLGFGVRLLLQQGALMHFTAFSQLLHSVFELELRAVTIPLKST